MAEIRDILGFPFKMAGTFVRVAGRITIGSVGFVLMGAGLLCVSPLQIWCNEAQERYVLAIDPAALEIFRAICERERCPFAVLGTARSPLAASSPRAEPSS